jgi:hypothetical protein
MNTTGVVGVLPVFPNAPGCAAPRSRQHAGRHVYPHSGPAQHLWQRDRLSTALHPGTRPCVSARTVDLSDE